jgi:hypothetical protein
VSAPIFRLPGFDAASVNLPTLQLLQLAVLNAQDVALRGRKFAIAVDAAGVIGNACKMHALVAAGKNDPSIFNKP